MEGTAIGDLVRVTRCGCHAEAPGHIGLIGVVCDLRAAPYPHALVQSSGTTRHGQRFDPFPGERPHRFCFAPEVEPYHPAP